MSYQVLARKWRPKCFDEMVGQDHVLKALINALDQDRLHHAFLFTGTRGVGKTTIARILAKSINCEQGVSSKPCGKCSACIEISEGRFFDLIEVDAASRTKVEATRELLDNAQYAPTSGRYKVYLIDEVHMLSNHSFNALLKTLEEPPAHVKFLLATTDPERLPVTILSRCLQFNLKRLSVPVIADHLEYVLKSEKIGYEKSAIIDIAKSAAGSMRDALSLLDQAISHCGGSVSETEVRSMLGMIDHDGIIDLLENVSDNDAAGVLDTIHKMVAFTPDFNGIIDKLIETLQQVAIFQLVPDAPLDFEERGLRRIAEKISKEDVQIYYQIALQGKRDFPLAPDLRGALEMVLIRMIAFVPFRETRDLSETAENSQLDNDIAKGAVVVKKKSESIEAKKADSWSNIIDRLKINGLLKELASHCTIEQQNDEVMALMLESSHKHLLNDDLERRLEAALCKYMKPAIKLKINIGTNSESTPALLSSKRKTERQKFMLDSITQDSNVRQIQEVFNATINRDSIRDVNRESEN